ncbi:MAG TPA: VanZ family protein [Chloroflexota bacterium]|nr:VanZ family protein [Chloroflexota bacterium]
MAGPLAGNALRAAARALWRVGPAALWATAIYWFSDQPHLPQLDLTLLDLLAKKSAHAAGYAVFAVLLQRALDPGRHDAGRRRLAWLLAVAYAVSDEWHQAFVPGRTATPLDVAIDGAGAAVGLRLWPALRDRASPLLRRPRAPQWRPPPPR